MRAGLLVAIVLFCVPARAAVEVTFVSNGGSVDQATTFEVTVHSTDTTAREVSPIQVEVPSALLLGSRPTSKGLPAVSIQSSEIETKDLNSGGSVSQAVFLRPLTFKQSLSPGSLFFRSDELPVYSIVEYSESPGRPPTQIRQKHMVRVTGPLVGIAVGGFIGVALAVLFTVAHAKSQSKPVPGWKQQCFTLLTGMLTAIIVALIRNADTTLLKAVGVVVAIYDYRGGILVGLLFQPIAAKLGEWIKGGMKTSEPTEPAAPPATEGAK